MSDAKRKYALPDIEMAWFASQLAIILTENLTDMAKYGITAQNITTLATLAHAFEVFPSDAYYAAQITDAVYDRNAKQQEIEKRMKIILIRAKAELPERKERYAPYTLEATQKLSVPEFIFAARELARVAAEDLATLDDAGLAQSELDELEAEAQVMYDLQVAVAAKVRQRSEKAYERITKGNELYALVARYAGFGKSEYSDVPVEHDKFVIYSESHVPKTPPAAPIVEVIDGYAELIFSQEVTSARLRYKFTANGEFIEVVKSPNEPHFIGTGHAIIYLEGEGRNAAGWGATGVKVIVNDLQPPGNPVYNHALGRFEYEMAEGAEQTELEVSYDDGVTYQQIFISSETIYVWTPPSGTLRARFRSIRGGVMSGWIEIIVVIP